MNNHKCNCNWTFFEYPYAGLISTFYRWKQNWVIIYFQCRFDIPKTIVLKFFLQPCWILEKTLFQQTLFITCICFHMQFSSFLQNLCHYHFGFDCWFYSFDYQGVMECSRLHFYNINCLWHWRTYILQYLEDNTCTIQIVYTMHLTSASKARHTNRHKVYFEKSGSELWQNSMCYF